MLGEIARSRRGYFTPDAPPTDEFICRRLFIPATEEFLALVSGAIAELTRYYNYEQQGTLTPLEVTELMSTMLQTYYDSTDDCSGSEGVPTPFWDEGQDVDDQESAETQTWYGEVDDPGVPADEISFVENAGIWVITGFIAYSGQIGAAIFFHTIAPSFVLAWHRGDVGEIWRIIVDSADFGTVNTASAAENDVVQKPILAGEGEHDIVLVKVS